MTTETEIVENIALKLMSAEGLYEEFKARLDALNVVLVELAKRGVYPDVQYGGHFGQTADGDSIFYRQLDPTPGTKGPVLVKERV